VQHEITVSRNLTTGVSEINVQIIFEKGREEDKVDETAEDLRKYAKDLQTKADSEPLENWANRHRKP